MTQLTLNRALTLGIERSLPDAHVYVLTGTPLAPLSLYAALRSMLAQQYALEVTPLFRTALDEHRAASAQNQLFAPARLFWVAESYLDVSAKELDLLYAVLAHAHTTQRYVLFIPEYSASKMPKDLSVCVITIPERSSASDCAVFQKVFNLTLTPQKEALVLRMLRDQDQLSVDEVVILIRAVALVQSKFLPAAHAMLTDVYRGAASLFEVAQLFFARKTTDFFVAWDHISTAYPTVFWINYWSDLLWRAYHVVRYLRCGKHTEAKKIGVRLPFSFMQHQWKTLEPEHLARLLHFLYEADVRLKRGSEFSGLELFFATHFSR